MRHQFLAIPFLVLMGGPVAACDLVPFSRPLTLAEKIAGLSEIFGGTVIGYETEDGTQLVGPFPAQCLNEAGRFDWVDWDDSGFAPECAPYLDTSAALFRVDTAIVGPPTNEVAKYEMTWGDGDCNIDFEIGESWLIAGYWFTQELRAPIRENEIAILRRLAARPAFDFRQLYPHLSP